MTDVSEVPQAPLRIAMAGLFAMAVGIGIGRFVYTPILPPMMAAMGMSTFVAGVIASANYVGYLAGALIATRASLPGTPRLWLLAALMGSAVSTCVMGVTDSVLGFVVLRFLGGIASALVLILASAQVLDRVARANRPRLGALHFAGVGCGIALSAAVVAVQLVSGGDWAHMWLAVGIASAIAVLVVVFLLPSSPASRHAPEIAARPQAWTPPMIRMAIAYGLFGFGYVITATFLVAIVRTSPITRPIEPFVWICVGVAAVPSVPLWMALGRRVGTAKAYGVAAVTEAIGVLASVVSVSLVGLIVAGVLLGGTFMGLTALGLLRGRELAKGDPRPVMATLTSAFGVGQILGPAAAGLMSDLLGGFLVPSLLAAIGLIVAAFLAWPDIDSSPHPA